MSQVVDTTPASNIMMTNLSDQDNGIPKNQFDKCQDKENQVNKKEKSTKLVNKNLN